RGFSEDDLRGVLFTGFIPHEHIHMAYQLAEFFILATLNESFAFPLVEAMACGCPVIGPATGACPEIGASAIRLADPHDQEAMTRALLELDESKTLREDLRRAGIERAKEFTWRETAKRTLAVFNALAPEQTSGVQVPR